MNITAFDPRWIQSCGLTGVNSCHESIIMRPHNACGIRIDCPMGCDHRISIYTTDAPPRWVECSTYFGVYGDDIRKVSVKPSVNVLECCQAHFTIENGEVRAA